MYTPVERAQPAGSLKLRVTESPDGTKNGCCDPARVSPVLILSRCQMRRNTRSRLRCSLDWLDRCSLDGYEDQPGQMASSSFSTLSAKSIVSASTGCPS